MYLSWIGLLCVCASVLAHKYVYVCTQTCVYAHKYVCMHTNMYVRISKHVLKKQMRTCMFAHMDLINLCIHTQVLIRVFARVHTHIVRV
jgi:hypothetical protein